ncbi:hypothetical protein FACS1894111_08250 [Clostridia bacterium]|nr:hypothetical protein FACS1894111_08250 [Clostridia bacterium]
MKNNPVGGIYRTNSVFITGTRYEPPLPEILPYQLRAFFEELPYKIMPPIYLAAYTHAEFVKIHPFLDGNGRTSRMIMNYQLMRNGFFPISIEQEVRLSYFKHLECYALYGELEPFADMVADLEEKRLREQL